MMIRDTAGKPLAAIIFVMLQRVKRVYERSVAPLAMWHYVELQNSLLNSAQILHRSPTIFVLVAG